MITDKQSLMCYGASGAGKSTQARYVAEYVSRVYGKKTRLIALDRGSLWNPSQDLVDTGLIIPLEFPTSHEFNPFSIMRKLRRGEWPKGGMINKPTPIESKNAKGELEIKYKTNTEWVPWSAEDTEEVGAIVIDSITSFATSFMSDAKQKNIRAGAEPDSTPRLEEGEQMGTNTQRHYGDAHTEILDLLQAFQALPVHITLFTSLEGKGEDQEQGIKRPVLGPETVGKALNGKLPSRVNHCFHLVAEGAGSKKSVKAWYDKHPSDVPSMMWPGKVTMPPPQLQEFWKKYPFGYVPLTLEKGIAEFFEFRDSLREKGGK